MEASQTAATEVRTRRQDLKGRYVVLREVTDAGELAAILEGNDKRVFVEVETNVSAKSSDGAIRAVAITEDEVATGRYVAPPLSSFRTAVVRSVPQLFMD